MRKHFARRLGVSLTLILMPLACDGIRSGQPTQGAAAIAPIHETVVSLIAYRFLSETERDAAQEPMTMKMIQRERMTRIKALQARKRASRGVRRPNPRPAPTGALQGQGTPSLALLDHLADCESGRDPSKNTGNGYIGAYQFLRSTWDGLVRRIGRADLVGSYFPPYEVQRWVTQHINLSAFPRQFPLCTRKLRAAGWM